MEEVEEVDEVLEEVEEDRCGGGYSWVQVGGGGGGRRGRGLRY